MLSVLALAVKYLSREEATGAAQLHSNTEGRRGAIKKKTSVDTDKKGSLQLSCKVKADCNLNIRFKRRTSGGIAAYRCMLLRASGVRSVKCRWRFSQF